MTLLFFSLLKLKRGIYILFSLLIAHAVFLSPPDTPLKLQNNYIFKTLTIRQVSMLDGNFKEFRENMEVKKQVTYQQQS